MLGTKRRRSRRLPTPPTPRGVVSLHSDYNPTPKTQKDFRGGVMVEDARAKPHQQHRKMGLQVKTPAPHKIRARPVLGLGASEAESNAAFRYLWRFLLFFWVLSTSKAFQFLMYLFRFLGTRITGKYSLNDKCKSRRRRFNLFTFQNLEQT